MPEYDAIVKGDECKDQGWEDGDRLMLIDTLDTFDEEKSVHLYLAFNIDKDESGTILSGQFTREG